MMPLSPDDEIIPWVKSKKRMDKDFFASMMGTDAFGGDQFEVASKVKVPTLLIMGDRDMGSIVSTEVAEKLAGLMPELQVAHLKGANHDIRRAKFDKYMQALKTFLTELSQ